MKVESLDWKMHAEICHRGADVEDRNSCLLRRAGMTADCKEKHNHDPTCLIDFLPDSNSAEQEDKTWIKSVSP